MVARQKQQRPEIIAIDSGSTDRTLGILNYGSVNLHARALALTLLFLMTGLQPALTSDLNLSKRYQKIKNASQTYGAGGNKVLAAAYKALSDRPDSNVGIEDLWATALKEGKNLFDRRNLWASTGPEMTGDMLGQTTIGPWQLTIQNVRKYGIRYGIKAGWTDTVLVSRVEKEPELQGRLAADFIEESYRLFGKRSPYALQRYFWLDGFLKKNIAQGPWYKSVLAESPALMIDTGFYAKQLLLGSRFNPHGLLYWLSVTGDEEAIRQALRLWSENGYAILREDLSHCACDPAFQHYLERFL